MKRLLSFVLVVALAATLAVPCFAVSEEDTRSTTGVTYDSTSGTGYDPAWNRFRMTGYTSMSGKKVIVHTEFELLNYGYGEEESLDDTEQVAGTSGSVVFSDGTALVNNRALTGSQSFSSSTGDTFYINYNFTGIVSSVDCKHYLKAYANDKDGNRTYKNIQGSTYVWVA